MWTHAYTVTKHNSVYFILSYIVDCLFSLFSDITQISDPYERISFAAVLCDFIS
jgi:DMSO/TMAO reductase YedYZ heme-binding membrane subunit